jgi:hypothetical protein
MSNLTELISEKSILNNQDAYQTWLSEFAQKQQKIK